MQLHLLYILTILLLLPRIHGTDDDIDEDWDEITSDLDGSVSVSTPIGQTRGFLVDLTDQNAERIIASNRFVFLLGFAPWCTRSSELMPEFAAAAAAFAGSVVFAKLDAVANTKAASRHQIKGYPTLLFFNNGSREQTYNGGDSKEEIINWIRKRTGSPVSTVSSKEDAQSLAQQVNVFVAGFFENLEGSEYESLVEAAKQEVGTEFVQTTSLEVARALNPEIESAPTVWVQKTEPENFSVYGGASFTVDELLKFVEINKYPLVLRLTPKNAARINYTPHKIQVFLFADASDIETISKLYAEAASLYKGEMLFLVVSSSDLDLAMPYLSLFGVQPGKPIVAAFNYENGLKYLLENEITLHNLKEFCTGLKDGTLPQHYKSQPVPLKKKGHLQLVVGKTFEEIVLDETKDVFLQLTSPWCSMCESANKTIDKLASAMKRVPSVVIAQIDASSNEHPKLEGSTFPTFLLYPAGNKDKPISSSKTNVKGFIQFIKTHATIPFEVPNEQRKPEAKAEVKTEGKDEL